MEPGEARGVELGDQIATGVELPGDGTEAGGRRGGGGVRGGEHSGRVVDTDRAVPASCKVVAEITGTAREVEHERFRGQTELVHRVPAPTTVEAEGDHPVHAVVARREPVEHLLDRTVL